MKYFYEDILSKVGDDGWWQVKNLLILWLILALTGARLILSGHVMKPDNFFCSDPEWNCSQFDKSWMSNQGETLQEKLVVLSYDHVYPRLKNILHEARSLSLLEEDFPSQYFCQVYKPSVREDGTCYWSNNRHIGDDNYTCRPPDTFHFYGESDVWGKISTDLRSICGGPFEVFLLTSLDFFFVILSILITGFFATLFGRRPGLIISLCSGWFGDILQLALYQYSAWGWHIGYLMSVQGIFSSVSLCIIILVETTGFKKDSSFCCLNNNSLLGMSFMIPFVLGKVVGDLLHNASHIWIPESDLYQIVYWSLLLAAGLSLTVIVLGILSETPRWLLTNYRLDKAEEVLQAISNTNGKTFEVSVSLDLESEGHMNRDGNIETRKQGDGAVCSDRVLVSFKESSMESESEDVLMEIRKYSLMKLFEHRTLLFTLAIVVNIIIVSFFHLLVNFRYERSISSTYTTRVLEIAGTVTVMLAEGLLGRRLCLQLLLLMVGCSMMAAQLVLDADKVIIPDNVKYDIQSGLLHVVDFCSTAMFSLLVWFSMSVYPTALRASVLFLYIGLYAATSLVAPNFMEILIMIDVLDLHEGQIAYFLFSMAAFVGALLSYYLPEIVHRQMPVTMDDVMFLEFRNR